MGEHKNIVVIFITIFFIFGIIFYVFFSPIIKKYLHYDKYDVNVREINETDDSNDSNEKRVRFNDNVEYNVYSHPTDTTTMGAKDEYLRSALPSKNFKTGNGYVLSSKANGSGGLNTDIPGSNEITPGGLTPYNYHSTIEDTPYGPYFAGTPVDGLTMSEREYDISDNLPLVISPYEKEYETKNIGIVENNNWADSYASKVINQDDQNKYMNKIKRSHESYGKSMCQFYKYQTNREVKMIKDPVASIFESNPNDPRLKGLKIKEIYDKQIPHFEDPQKKVESIMPGYVNYSNESDMNGALLNGSSIHGYDFLLDANQFDNFKH